MFVPTALTAHTVERARIINHQALSSQFSGLIATEGGGGLTATGQTRGGNFYSYLVDVNNTRFVPTSGTTGVNIKGYFIPGRFLTSVGSDENINLGGFTIDADYLACPFPEFWLPNNYPKGNTTDTPSGRWSTYEWQPFNNTQKLYYVRNNMEYIAPAGAYIFREERVVLIKLGAQAASNTFNFNFVYSDALMTYDNNPNRVRTGGLDKNTVINYIRRYKDKVVNQTLIT